MIDKYVGKVYGRWTVESFSHRVKKNRYYNCLCKCGNSGVIQKGNLASGKTTSCGCLKKELDHSKKTSTVRRLFSKYKNSSKKGGKEFRLSLEQFIGLTSGRCYYCDKEPCSIFKYKTKITYIYNGIDRKNSDIGYVPDNCVSCCSVCNYFKGTVSYKYFINIIKNIFDHRINGSQLKFSYVENNPPDPEWNLCIY